MSSSKREFKRREKKQIQQKIGELRALQFAHMDEPAFQDIDVISMAMVRTKDGHAIQVYAAANSNKTKLEALAKQFLSEFEYEIIYTEESMQMHSAFMTGAMVRNERFEVGGTAGGIFTIEGRDGRFGLSNNHVLSPGNQGQKGDRILNGDGEAIGVLEEFIPLEAGTTTNTVDATLFRYNDDVEPKWAIPATAFVTPHAQPSWKVHKTGARTGYRQGKIESIVADCFIAKGGKKYYFKPVMTIRPTGNDYFSDEGDSGALLLTQQSDVIVGIVFGRLMDLSFACHLAPIKSWNLELESE